LILNQSGTFKKMNSQPQYISKKTNALKSYQLTDFIDLLLVFRKYTQQHNIEFFTQEQKEAFEHIKETQFDFNRIFDNKIVFDLFIKLLTQKKEFKLSKKLKSHLTEDKELTSDILAIDQFAQWVCFYNLIKTLKKLNTTELQTIYKDFYEIKNSEDIPKYFQNKANYSSLENFLATGPNYSFLTEEKPNIVEILEFW